METIKLGNFLLVSMDVQDYNKQWDCNIQELYGQDLERIVWVEKYDNEGRLVGMSMENMYVFAGNVFGHTSRGLLCEASFAECLEVIRWIEEL